MSDRKKDHLKLAFQSRIEKTGADSRFDYEPMLSAHPNHPPEPFAFAGKTMRLPVWVSSMTGGTDLAGTINRNLAQACREFGMGMGLGSCRILLDDAAHLADFDVRHILGDEQPLYANLGICQLEKLMLNHQLHRVDELVAMLNADGIIIHVNPLQEAFLKADALQCGYCTSGMIMSAASLLSKNAKPRRAEIVKHMDANVCRCGTYARIVNAIEIAAGTAKEVAE